MQLGTAGRNLIQHFEQCRLTAYQDVKGIWTIGWGHTGPEVGPGLTWTQEQADDAFVRDTGAAVLGVNRSLDVAVNQNQFDALVSFTFNVGVNSEAHSTLVSLINNGHFAAAAAQFPLWDHSGGVEIPGLKLRREAEQALFLSPV
jgi:lysozyme